MKVGRGSSKRLGASLARLVPLLVIASPWSSLAHAQSRWVAIAGPDSAPFLAMDALSIRSEREGLSVWFKRTGGKSTDTTARGQLWSQVLVRSVVRCKT